MCVWVLEVPLVGPFYPSWRNSRSCPPFRAPLVRVRRLSLVWGRRDLVRSLKVLPHCPPQYFNDSDSILFSLGSKSSILKDAMAAGTPKVSENNSAHFLPSEGCFLHPITFPACSLYCCSVCSRKVATLWEPVLGEAAVPLGWSSQVPTHSFLIPHAARGQQNFRTQWAQGLQIVSNDS